MRCSTLQRLHWPADGVAPIHPVHCAADCLGFDASADQATDQDQYTVREQSCYSGTQAILTGLQALLSGRTTPVECGSP
jgi:hypothetical protein